MTDKGHRIFLTGFYLTLFIVVAALSTLFVHARWLTDWNFCVLFCIVTIAGCLIMMYGKGIHTSENHTKGLGVSHVVSMLLLCILVSIDAKADVMSPLLRASRLPSVKADASKRIASKSNEEIYFPVVLKLQSADAALPEYVNELYRRGALVLAMVPQQQLDALSDNPIVYRMELNATPTAKLVDALQFCNTPLILPAEVAGDGTIDSLTGKGVVVGLCDTGLDPNHPTFLDKDGKTRFKKFITYDMYSPELTIVEGDEVNNITTDNNDEYHATHVAGILGGNGGGTPYIGLASESELVAAVGPLCDMFLLAGCEEIIAYAKKVNKPAVINISISSDIGPHDGTTLFCQYMTELCKDATICISAGNEGERRGYLSKQFTGNENEFVRTYMREYPHWHYRQIDGTLDLWGTPGARYEVDILCTDFDNDNILHRYKAIDLSSGKSEFLIASPGYASMVDVEAESIYENADGYVYVKADISPENSRMNVTIQTSYAFSSSATHYCIYGVEVRAKEPVDVEIYSSPSLFLNNHWDKQASWGTSERTVNDFCSGEGPICVGAFSTQNTFTTLEGEKHDFSNLTVGDIAYFSSHGVLNNGKILPDICAPGAQLVSSLSSEYINAHGILPSSVAEVTRNGETYYFGYEQGTSMSAPYTAGVCALWLQACPDLTPAQIRNIAVETASAPTMSPSSPQWGNGILNASAGLLMARKLSGVDRIYNDGNNDTPLQIMRRGTEDIAITGISPAATHLQIHSTTGAMVHTIPLTASDSECGTIVFSCALAPGIYILSATGENAFQSAKLLIQ